MNVKLRTSLLLICLSGSCLMGYPQGVRADEPVYENKPLTSWLQDFAYGNYQLYGLEPDMEKHHAAERAIQEMGTKAIPALLDRLTTVSTAPLDSKQNYSALYELYEQNERTRMGFAALGVEARPAIPDLIKLLASAYDAAHQSLSEPSARLKESEATTAASILRGMGEVSIPPLIEALDSKDSKIRFGAAMALERFRDQAEEVVPSLIESLEDEDKDVRWGAARSIGDLRQMPEISVPALATVLREDQDGNVRCSAIFALEKFGADATTAIPELSRATRDPEPFIQLYAREALEKIRAAAAQRVAGP